MKKKYKKIVLPLSIIAIIIILLISVFYISFKYNINKSYGDYEQQISSEIEKINEINDIILEDELSQEKINEIIPTIDEKVSNLKEVKNT